MARWTRLPPRSPRGLVDFEEAQTSQDLAGPDSALVELARKMRLAEQALHDAMDDLAQTEHRFAELRRSGHQPRGQPDWLVAAQDRERQTGAALEDLFQRIAMTPAQTNVGLRLKVQLVVTLYGESHDDQENDADLLLRLLESLLGDLSNQ